MRFGPLPATLGGGRSRQVILALLVVPAVGEPRPATPAREALAHHAKGLSTGRYGDYQLLEDRHPLLFVDQLVLRKKRLQ